MPTNPATQPPGPLQSAEPGPNQLAEIMPDRGERVQHRRGSRCAPLGQVVSVWLRTRARQRTPPSLARRRLARRVVSWAPPRPSSREKRCRSASATTVASETCRGVLSGGATGTGPVVLGAFVQCAEWTGSVLCPTSSHGLGVRHSPWPTLKPGAGQCSRRRTCWPVGQRRPAGNRSRTWVSVRGEPSPVVV